MDIKQRLVLGVVLLLTGVVNLSGGTLPASARNANDSQDGMPGRRVGAGVRGPGDACIEGTQPQMAVIPTTNLGLTAQAHPTLLFYLPAVDPSRTLEFVLRDADDEEVYAQVVAAQGDAGIIRLDLPVSPEVSLVAGQDYHWYFSIICDGGDRSQDITSHGWIRRVDRAVSLAPEVKADDSLASAQADATDGLWLNALAQVDTLRRSPTSEAEATDLWAEWLLAPTLDLPSLTAEPPIVSPFTDSL